MQSDMIPKRERTCKKIENIVYSEGHSAPGARRLVQKEERMTKENIVLIGLPGAGKSTLGVVLAKMANYGYIDADLVIQDRHAKTLEHIIDDEGVEGFLAIENEVLRGLAPERTVIATGGSAVYSDAAMRHLGLIGTIVYLKAEEDEIEKRLGDLHERGVVMRDGTVGDFSALCAERIPLYENYADITIDVTHLPIREAAAELKGILEGRGLLSLPHSAHNKRAYLQWRDEDRTYNMQRQVSFDWLDSCRHLRPAEALRIFGDTANADFADLGQTYQSMIEKGYYFIVTHANCHLVRQPEEEERILVRTWPCKIKGMQVSRNFSLIDPAGKPLAFCEMVYLVMDTNTGHPIRVKDFPLVPLYEVEREVPLEKRTRVKRSDDMNEVACLSPRFSDLDANGHVNNTHYPTFAYDALPGDLQKREWTDFQVEFSAEVHLEDEIHIVANDAHAACEAGEWVKLIGSREDGTTNFACAFKFKDEQK